MSARDKLFGYKGRVTIGEIQLDASISEVHALEAELTEHPVEEGFDISDHYKLLPTPFQITGVVSDSPIATDFPGQTLVNSVQSIGDGSLPSQDAWELANSYFINRTLLTVATSLQTYENVVLLSFKVTRDKDTGRCLKFEAVVKKLRVVKTQSTSAIEVPKAPKTTTVESKKEAGKKPKKKPEQTKSMAAKMADALLS